MVRKLVLSLIAVLCCGALLAVAQNRQVSGTVTSQDGQPVVGASVIVDGTSNGTTTAANGKFSIAAPANATLTVSFLGYETQYIPVAGKTNIDVILKEDSQAIDEVTIVAFGAKRKQDLVGSVASVKTDIIKN